MFYCEITKTGTKPGEPLNKVPVVRREKVYYRWVQDEKSLQWSEVEISKGWEVVKEINASDEGLKLWEDMLASGEIQWVETQKGKEKQYVATLTGTKLV